MSQYNTECTIDGCIRVQQIDYGQMCYRRYKEKNLVAPPMQRQRMSKARIMIKEDE